MSKTKSTKKYKLNPLAVVALVLCALIAVYCGTTAWLTSGVPLNPIRLVSLEDFAYTIEVSTDGGATWAPQDDVLTFEKSEIGNLANVCFKVKQTGNGVAFTRVRISQEWVVLDNSGKVTERLQGAYNLPFELAENNDKLFDNRSNDGFVYYAGAFPLNNNGVEIFSGIDMGNFDTSVIEDNVTLHIDVTVDAVQFNRYQQFWGIDTLPWR
ncbi:MAG: hypothetical protein IJN38_08640 [Clostridia bacterium]|nr:hypothetical protein [Clostridia bacterium]